MFKKVALLFKSFGKILVKPFKLKENITFMKYLFHKASQFYYNCDKGRQMKILLIYVGSVASLISQQ